MVPRLLKFSTQVLRQNETAQKLSLVSDKSVRKVDPLKPPLPCLRNNRVAVFLDEAQGSCIYYSLALMLRINGKTVYLLLENSRGNIRSMTVDCKKKKKDSLVFFSSFAFLGL